MRPSQVSIEKKMSQKIGIKCKFTTDLHTEVTRRTATTLQNVKEGTLCSSAFRIFSFCDISDLSKVKFS